MNPELIEYIHQCRMGNHKHQPHETPTPQDHKPRKDLTGKRYGRLTVTKYLGITRWGKKSTVSLWQCDCDCGNKIEVQAPRLTRGNTRSCGCLRKDLARQRKKHQ